MTTKYKRAHYGIDEFHGATSQRSKPVPKKTNRDVIRIIMLKATKNHPEKPWYQCHRCKDKFLGEYMILINMGNFKHPDYVCRLCYDRRSDIKV